MFKPIPSNIDALTIAALRAALLAAKVQMTTMNNQNVVLDAKERQTGVTVGPSRKPFLDYYYGQKNNYANLKPSQTKVSEADADKHYFIHDNFAECLQIINDLKDMGLDLQINSEHFAMSYANDGRNAVHQGQENNLPDADAFGAAFDELYPDLGPKPEPTA